MAINRVTIQVTGDTKDVDKAWDELGKRIERTSKTAFKIAGDEAKKSAQAQISSLKEIGKGLDDLEKQFTKSEKEKTKIVKQESKERKQLEREVANAPRTDFGGVVGSRGFYDAQTKGLIALRKEFPPTSQAAKDLTNQIRSNQSMMREWNGTSKMSNLQLLEMGENLTVVTAGLFAAIKPIINITKETYLLGNTLTLLRKSFEGVAKREGMDAVATINMLKEATGNTVTEMRLLQIASKGKFLDVNLKAIPELIKFATIRAKEMGMEVDYMVDSIITGLGRKSPLILDNLGLKMKQLDKAVIEVARSKGVLIDKVDEETRAMYLTEAAVKVARDELEKSTISIDDQGFAFDRLIAKAEDLKGQFGVGVVKGVNDSTKAIEKYAGLTRYINPVSFAMGAFIDNVKDGTISIEELGEGIFKAFTGLPGWLSIAIDGFDTWKTLIVDIKSGFDNLDVALGTIPNNEFLGGVLSQAIDVANQLQRVLGLQSDISKTNLIQVGSDFDIFEERRFDKFGNLIMPDNVNRTDWRIDWDKKAPGATFSKTQKSKGGKGGKKDVEEVKNEVKRLQEQILKLKAELNITPSGTVLFVQLENQIKNAEDKIIRLGKTMKELFPSISGTGLEITEVGKLREMRTYEPSGKEIDMSYEGIVSRIMADMIRQYEHSLGIVSETGSEIQNIMDILGVGTDNFVAKMLNFAQDFSSILSSLLNIEKKTGWFSSLLSFIPGIGQFIRGDSGGGGTAGAIGNSGIGSNKSLAESLNMSANGGKQAPVVNVFVKNEMGDMAKVGVAIEKAVGDYYQSV